ncbi:MAG: hypothetical protein ACYCWE_16805 [Eubacteriales bacterium]
MAYNLTRTEKETIIIYNEAASTARITTFNRAFIRKLLILCEALPNEATDKGPSPIGEYCFIIPKKMVRINGSLLLSEEVLKQRRANAAAMNKNKAKTTERIVKPENMINGSINIHLQYLPVKAP